MLSLIFGSEARAKLFNLLLLQADKSFKTKQFSEETGLSPAMTRKELKLLSEFGLVSEKDRFWQVNPDFILFSELKSLVMKAQILSSQQFIENLKKISDPALFILTGCFSGDLTAKTDILLVGPVKRRAFLKLITDLEASLNREVNYTIMDEEEFNYRQEVMDIFLYNILNGKNIILIDKLNLKSLNSNKQEKNKLIPGIEPINEADNEAEKDQLKLEEVEGEILEEDLNL